VVGRGWQLLIGAVAALGVSSASAENLDAGKPAPVLFAATCTACHNTPRGLAKGSGAGSIASFLRQHYTASPESANALAAYLVASGSDPRAGQASKGREPEGAAGAKRRAATPEPAEAAPAGKRRPPAEADTESGKQRKQSTARRPETLDERLPQAHGPREAQPEEPKRQGRKRQDAKSQEPKETAVPAAAHAAEPEAAPTPPPSVAPAPEPAAVARSPAETPDQPAFSVPSP